MNGFRLSYRQAAVAACLLSPGLILAADNVALAVKDREAHQQRVEVVKTRVDELGKTLTETNSYVQLESGLNFRNAQGAWEETKAEFELVPEGAIAWKGQHKVSLAGDLNTAEAIQLRLPDGRLVAGHVLGLAYYDSESGDAVMIASVKDSGGWQVTPNQIVYPDAFSGVEADVRYTFSRSGFEQDIILREQPPAPEKFGFNPATTRLEVWTEFTTAPEPRVKRGSAEQLAAMAATEEADETLDFGSMEIGEGRSFLLGREIEMGDAVRKRWLRSDQGRRFLVEAVDLPVVAPELEALPAAREKGGAALPSGRPSKRQQALNTVPAKAKRATAQTAMHTLESRKDLVAAYQRPGLVVDYKFTVSGDQSDFTFQSDTTYLVTGSRDCSGTTTLEGGCVIKFEKYVSGSVDPRLYIRGAFVCKTSSYKPAVFTARDDDSVGEPIASSSGNPGTDKYAYFACRFLNGPAAKIEHVRVRNAVFGLSWGNTDTSVPYTVAHAQLVNVQAPLYASSANPVNCYNLLISQVLPGSSVFNGSGTPFYGEHLTIHGANSLLYNGTLTLKNSLLVQINSIQSYTGSASCTQISPDTGVFQSVYAGNHYLPLGSPYRNPADSVAIDATLAAELKQLTTEAPLLLSGALSSSTRQLWPRVQRDTDVPDRGYHYPALDYLLSSVVLTDKLTLENGVAAAAVGATGIKLGASSQLFSEGRAERLNVLTRYNSVQEQGLTTDTWGSLLKIDGSYSPRPIVSLRFSEIAGVNQANHIPLLEASYNTPFDTLTVEFCQLRNLGLSLWPESSYATAVNLRNNLVERCNFSLNHSYYSQNTPFTVTARNNLFWRGNLNLIYDYYAGGNNPGWTFKDNLLDRVTNSLTGGNGGTGSVTRTHNGFVSGTFTNELSGTAGDQTLLTADYQENGAWGNRYYLATGSYPSLGVLIDQGSQTADDAGLHHFTVKPAAGTKEAASQVDIGYHYVGLNSSGTAPNDHDGDGLPDYVEDRDGNGSTTPGAGETAWQTSNGVGGGSNVVLLFTPLLQ